MSVPQITRAFLGNVIVFSFPLFSAQAVLRVRRAGCETVLPSGGVAAPLCLVLGLS